MWTGSHTAEATAEDADSGSPQAPGGQAEEANSAPDPRQHQAAGPGEKRFKCAVCGKGFSFHSYLKRHERSHYGTKPYRCEICHKSYRLKKSLDYHVTMHSRNKLFASGQAEEANYAAHLRQHEAAGRGEKRFKCTVCSRGFSFHSHLKRHERTHTGEKPYWCQICCKSFSWKESLVCHVTIHSRNKLFAGGQAEEANSAADFRQHQAAGPEEKRFKCTVCDWGFSRSYELLRHEGIHTVEKPF